jgi:hypothetical protein
MNVDIVDKYCTDDNNPIKNLRLNNDYFTEFFVEHIGSGLGSRKSGSALLSVFVSTSA